ncbi:sulfatase family protein [Capnocytophaga cynodegmi]|uniref:sulfatase family protein n=1 Tax=Capnocytophaga cynodegmi TaxID=28189 RepID=UPI001ACAEEFB|nr:arylsulfatase [Capnocytophaga cynodegmi]GIM53806.1 arylsulfatase [Capnocytophaga cynodegmi]
MKIKIINLLFLLLIFSCGVRTKKEDDKVQQKPNVVLIVADDLGYGDLSCYGAERIQTPHVDKLADGGILFTNAHTTAATCTPSRYSLFTGEYNWRKKNTGIADGDAGMIIRPEQTTIADVFKSAGYTTGAVGKWHLGLGDTQGSQNWNSFISPGPSDIGFDYSFLMAATGDRVPCVWVENQKVANYDANAPIEVSYKEPFEGEPLGKTHPELLTKLKPSLNHGHNQAIVNGISRIGYMKGGGKALWEDENIADSIASKAVQFIDKHTKSPFFLYVGTNDIHVPRYPHTRFAGKSGMGYRGDAILQFDWTIGQIVEALKRKGLFENTLIIVTSDNGPVIDDGYQDQAEELLGNHNPWGKFHHRGGKYSNFEAGTCVPFIVSFPKTIKSGTSDALFSQVDLFATLTTLINKNIPEGAAKDSQNQLRTLLGKETKGRSYIITSANSLSINDGKWKYIEPNNRNAYQKLTRTFLGNSPEEQLYHIEKDVSEKENVADKFPQKVKELKEILEQEKQKGYLK